MTGISSLGIVLSLLLSTIGGIAGGVRDHSSQAGLTQQAAVVSSGLSLEERVIELQQRLVALLELLSQQDQAMITTQDTSVDATSIGNNHDHIWFAPLPPMTSRPGKEYTGSDDFMELFTSDSGWSLASRAVDVFPLYGEWLLSHNATDEELQQVFAYLKQHDIALGLEIGPLYYTEECGEGIEGFTRHQWSAAADRIIENGGSLDYIVMDEPFYFAHVYTSDNSCNWSKEKIATEIADFIADAETRFPGIVVGAVEPITDSSAGAADADTYLDWLETYEAVTGEPLAFLHLDINWGVTNWSGQALQIESALASSETDFGIIYNSSWYVQSDNIWLSEAGEHVLMYEDEVGGSPDHVIFQSWNDKPDVVLPERGFNTFTNLIYNYLYNRSALGYRSLRNDLSVGADTEASNALAGYGSELIVDETVGTLWNAGSLAPEWFTVDLGTTYDLRQIELYVSQSPAGLSTHEVYVRGDSGDEWTLVHTFDEEMTEGDVLVYQPTADVECVEEIKVLTTESPSWVAWRDISVFGERNRSCGDTVQNLTREATITASAEIVDNPATFAIDGEETTSWNAGSKTPEWVELDLGAVHEVSLMELVVNQSPAGATLHTVYGKENSGDDWQILTTFSEITENGDVLRKSFRDTTEARYIKIETTESPSWVSWKEVKVFGR